MQYGNADQDSFMDPSSGDTRNTIRYFALTALHAMALPSQYPVDPWQPAKVA